MGRPKLTEEQRKESKERRKAYMVKWCAENKEHLKEYKAKWLESRKHKPTVYYLPEEHYVGITENLYDRIYKHKSLGKNIEGYRILKEFNTRAEALELEEAMHDFGYKGKHKHNVYK